MGKPMRGGSELRDLVKWAEEHGFTCKVTNSTHLAFRRPNTMPVFASYTPSCYHARRNTMRDLKHALLESEQRQQQATIEA